MRRIRAAYIHRDCWSSNNSECSKHDEAVLDGLQPHSNLRKQKIQNYGQHYSSYLEELPLSWVDKITGWWNEALATTGKNHATSSSMADKDQWQKLPSFRELSVCFCPNDTAMPLCPNVSRLMLVEDNEKLSVLKMMLETLCIDNVYNLLSLLLDCLQNLTDLVIQDCNLLNLSDTWR
ncbi:hypothetical protein Nepgr_026459 [Nepenthes gracilis]|uniref:Uncharacterized protein n=1 Tax=Nepenthes gracilis TaxID=150966 RepID=A0AAD3Y2H9_NEPGR|nr:hypothetical protein Nepgr_026459 [Nepenthes gracilis]